MAAAPKNRRNLAVIGGGVGIAAAGVITLLALDRPAGDEPTELAARAAAIPSSPNRPLEGGVVKPWDAKATSTRDQAIAQARQYGNIASARGSDDANLYGDLFGTEVGTTTGGTGAFGTGSGVGRLGSGGVRGGRVATGPTISIGQPTVRPTVAGGDGELDKAIVRRYIKRNIQKLQYCYEKELLAKPALSGTVATSFTITESGVVGSASASGVDATVASCMAQVIKGIEFPRPKGTGGVAVTYPFTVRPAAP